MKITHNNFLVVGDLMLDIYDEGNVSRVSPEAPVPVFLKKHSRYVLGGAANVVANIKMAQQKVSVCSVSGDDIAAERISEELTKIGVDELFILKCEDRCTSTKTRIVAQNNQQLVRIDNETTKDISDFQADLLIDMIKPSIDKYDLIVLSDYKKGLLTPYFCQALIALGKEREIKVLIDVKDTNIKKYFGAYLLKPNKLELETLSGIPITNKDSIQTASKLLVNKTGCQYVLTTLGGDGMFLYGCDGSIYIEEAEKREVYDVSGAGDTAISYLATGIASGLSIQEAIHLSNVAAGIKVTKMGTTPVPLREVLNDMTHPKRKNGDSYSHKIISWDDLELIKEAHAGQSIVFTNGCFDIIHMGHVTYLNKAASFGDLLIVGLNSDDSVKRLKGETRPINHEQDRAGVLAALRSVDYVVVFDEDTPENLIEAIRPNILVKGGDYVGNTIVGADFVRHYGGIVVTVPLVEGKSTTKVINEMKRAK